MIATPIQAVAFQALPPHQAVSIQAAGLTTLLLVMQNAVGAEKVNYQEGPRIIAWNTEATVDGTVREFLASGPALCISCGPVAVLWCIPLADCRSLLPEMWTSQLVLTLPSEGNTCYGLLHVGRYRTS